MDSSITSFDLNPRQNKNQEMTLSTIKERLSYKNEVSFVTPHILKFYAMLLVTEGEYEHVLDFKTYTLKAGDIFFICPNQIHYFVETEGFDGYIITFSEDFLKDYFISFNPMIRYELLYEFYVIKKMKLSDYTIKQFIAIYNLLLVEIKNDYDISQKIILQNLLSVILHNISREFKKIDLVSKVVLDNTFIDFKHELSKGINYKYNVQYYAEKLKISIRTLQIIAKKNGNKTPKEIIDDNLILECKRQLLSSDILIQDVASSLGFDDPSAFSKYFKKITSTSPLEFRRNFTE